MRGRSELTIVLMYVGIIAAAAGGIAFSLQMVVQASAGLSQITERDKTLLDLRIESAREIRQALNTPIRRPEPLPPITARVANAEAAKAPRSGRVALTQEARDALASSDWSPSPSHSYPVVDRLAAPF